MATATRPAVPGPSALRGTEDPKTVRTGTVRGINTEMSPMCVNDRTAC